MPLTVKKTRKSKKTKKQSTAPSDDNAWISTVNTALDNGSAALEEMWAIVTAGRYDELLESLETVADANKQLVPLLSSVFDEFPDFFPAFLSIQQAIYKLMDVIRAGGDVPAAIARFKDASSNASKRVVEALARRS